ncbi:MAG TPA: glycosyltransferase [Pyrinomonadaceae bacterium]|nr:glycosyltransferase [Pyrinomonadaceae bacterium]
MKRPGTSAEPLVSVCCVAYNQARYIRDALEGFLMQQTDFPFEIIVHDDCSTDGTTEILREYEARAGGRLRVMYEEENQYSKGKKVFAMTFAEARGRYVALCEGDDFWTDPLKLSKQVGLLEAHPGYAFCFHPARWLDEQSERPRHEAIEPPSVKEFYTLDDLLENANFIPTCSTMFRRELLGDYPEWIQKTRFGDVALYLFAAHRGKIGFINEPMATYRFHGGGVWGREARRAHLETLVKTLTLVGDNLRLWRRASFRAGLTRFSLELQAVCAREGEWAKAARAGLVALRAAPAGQRNYVLWTLAARLPARYLKHTLRKILKARRRGESELP